MRRARWPAWCGALRGRPRLGCRYNDLARYSHGQFDEALFEDASPSIGPSCVARAALRASSRIVARITTLASNVFDAFRQLAASRSVRASTWIGAPSQQGPSTWIGAPSRV